MPKWIFQKISGDQQGERDTGPSAKSGTGRAGTAKIRDGTRDKTGQSRKGCSKTGNHSDCPVPVPSRILIEK